MSRISFFTLGAAALIAGAPVAARSAPASAVSQPRRMTAAAMVDGMRPLLPRQFEGGAVLRAARAEGDLVIMTVEVPPQWMAQGVAVFTQAFTAGMCSQRDNPFFDNGLSLRIDTFSGSAEPTTGQVISGCPGR